MFEATAFEVRIKLTMYMSGQALAFGFELPNQGWVVFVYKLVEQGLTVGDFCPG